ncbi:sugar ABC transporter substrate-binding protein [Cohnella sp.]|uniref:sugar ABC transporter substrate-binding protein n=1 Tax=Cohnella sp. TaxID=1883426 RepID=UPI003568230D
MKKTSSTIIATALAVGLLAGCSSGQEEGPAASPKQPSSSGAVTPGQPNAYGWVKPAQPTVINFYQADRDNPDKVARDTVRLHDYLLDNFNVDLKKTVYDVDPKERLNLMLASGEYPEVIAAMDDDTVDKWKAQRKLIDLTPYVDQYGQNIKKALGDKYKTYLDEDGKLWGLPRGWGYLPGSDFTAHIRMDWYEEMGSPKIETPEDYYEVLKQMVAAHPTNTQGEKVYALSWNDQVNINNVMGIWGLKDGYKEDADHNLVHWLNTSEGLEAARYYNKIYRDGLLDPDLFINKFDDWKTKFANERIVGHIGSWWHSWNAGHEIWRNSVPDYQEDMRYVQISIKAADAEKAYLSPKDARGWNYTVLTDKAKDPEAIIKFLDFTMSPIGTRLLGWGVPNEGDSLWNYEGDGKWSFNDAQKTALLDGTFDYEKADQLGGNRYWLVHGQGLLEDDNKSTAWYDQNFIDEDKWKKLMYDNTKDTVYDNTARRVVFSVDNPYTLVNQQIEDLVKNGFAQAVTRKTEDEFVRTFNELKDKANKLGLQDLEKYRTEEYKKQLAILNQ